MNAISVILLMLFGAYFFFGAYKDFDWFYTGYKVRRAVEKVGRKTVRITFMVCGIIFILIGIIGIFM